MRIAGSLVKIEGSRYMGVDIPALDIVTQGRNRKDALFMAKDAIELLANSAGYDLKVTIIPQRGDTFGVESGDVKTLVAFMLHRLRQRSGLSLTQVAAKLGSSSKNAYARYEQGVSEPSLSKLDELVKALSPSVSPVLSVG